MINPTEYLPKSYHRRVSTYWWLARWSYLKFILREASSVFVGWTVLLTLVQIWAVTHGPSANAAFHEWMRHPLMLGVNVIAFLFVLFHAVTWFSLTPKTMVIRVKGQRVPDWVISGPNYAAWVLVSLGVAWVVLRG